MKVEKNKATDFDKEIKHKIPIINVKFQTLN